MSLQPEQIEQIRLFNWIRTVPEIARFTFSIPNERKTTPQQGLTLKRMGLRPGVSDIFVGVQNIKYGGYFLELKAGSNLPTEHQLQFMEDMSKQGYYCSWCKGYEKAKESIEWYLTIPKRIFNE